SHEQHVEERVFGDLRSGFVHGFSYGADENDMYVGYLAVALAFVGLVAEGRRQWPLALAFVVFLWLAFGNRAQPSLWELLHRAPLYATMRVAQRFRWVWLLVLALFAGFGLERMTVWARRGGVPARGAALLSSVLVLVVLVDLILTGHQA